MHKVEIPRENANDDSVVITNINVKNYQKVNAGDKLFEFETSKTIIEVEAEIAGIISLNISIGETVPVGSIAAAIDSDKFYFDNKINSQNKDIDNNEKFTVKAIELIKKFDIEKEVFSNLDYVTARDVEEIISQNLSNKNQNLPKNFEPNDIALFGAGLQCQVVIDMVKTEKIEIEIAAIIDSNPALKKLDNINIYNKIDLDKLYERGLRNIHICIGNGKIKKEISDDLKSRGFNIISIIAPSAIISKSANLEEGIFIGSGVYIGRDVEVKELCQINHLVSIAHHCFVGIGSFFADGCKIGGSVIFGDYVNLGIGVIINRDINIVSNSSVPSGATITDNIQIGTIYKPRKTSK